MLAAHGKPQLDIAPGAARPAIRVAVRRAMAELLEPVRLIRLIVYEPVSPPTGFDITALARLDVFRTPGQPWDATEVTSASYDPTLPTPRPFMGRRLQDAVHRPTRADVLCFSHSAAMAIVPLSILGGIPTILILDAVEKLWASVPTRVVRMAFSDEPACASSPELRARRRRSFVSDFLLDALTYATPSELCWLSGPGA